MVDPIKETGDESLARVSVISCLKCCWLDEDKELTTEFSNMEDIGELDRQLKCVWEQWVDGLGSLAAVRNFGAVAGNDEIFLNTPTLETCLGVGLY